MAIENGLRDFPEVNIPKRVLVEIVAVDQILSAAKLATNGIKFAAMASNTYNRIEEKARTSCSMSCPQLSQWRSEAAMVSRMIALGVVVCMTMTWISHAEAQELNWAQKMFSELKHDFGTVARGADTRAYITLTNLYEEDVGIVNVGTTCGCTAARPDKTLLKTHEQAKIEVKMNTVKFMRRKDSNVDVTLTFHRADGTATETVRVPITAYIRSDVVVTPEPGNADFGSVEQGVGGERRLEIAYAGRDDWKIKDVRVPNQNLEAAVREVVRTPGQVRYELVVKLKNTAPLGPIQDQIALITDDEQSTEVPVLVVGKVEPDIVVSHTVYPLGNLKPGDSKPFSVVLRGKRPFVISHVQCDSEECFEVVQPTNESKTIHVVNFKMTAPAKPGDFSEKISFTIAGRPEPISFKAEGKIGAGT